MVKPTSLARHSKRRSRGTGGLRSLGLELLEDRRVLATLTLNVTHDDTDQFGNPLVNDGDLTLRDAIAYINGDFDPQQNDIQSNGVVHIDLTEGWGTNDKIIIPSSIGSTITLTEEEMEIKRSVELQGPGSGMLTIDADSDDDGVGDSRIFYISDGLVDSLQDVSISGLTFAGC